MTGQTDWMQLTISVPYEDGLALVLMLREKLGFKEVDWCHLERPDHAVALYSPTPPLLRSMLDADEATEPPPKS